LDPLFDDAMNPFRWLLAALLAANGLAMLTAPREWYDAVPGVALTGPFNPHFVRDIGCAYVVAGLGLLWRALDAQRGMAAALAGAAFLILHAFVHIGEVIAGVCGTSALWRDAPGVIVPAVLALVLALPSFNLRRPIHAA
jgi:uncharacterized protein YjeT (DUF2065 family)